MKTVLLILALSLTAAGQTKPEPPPPSTDPVFLVAAGASYNGTAIPKTAGWASVAFEAAPGLYMITTLDQTLKTESLRTGVAKKIIQRHNLTFLLHADAGITATTLGVTTNAVGSFSGGPMLMWKVPALKGLYGMAVVRFVAVTSQTVKPLYELGLGWGF